MDELGLLLQSHPEEKARELLRERYSLSGSQKPFLVLHEGVNDKVTAPKKKSRRRQRKSAFSRQLAEFVRTADQTYSLYEPLHELWKSYIAGLLGTGPAALQALLSADWHGALVRVRACRNASLVGTEGLVLWESRSQWLLATQRGFKQVPKHGTVVELNAGSSVFAIVGDRVLCRSSERTTRKFKPHDVSQIVPLLNGIL